MKQDLNELRAAMEKKSIKVDGFSTREQLCVFVALSACVRFCIYECLVFLILIDTGAAGALIMATKTDERWTRVPVCEGERFCETI